MMERKRRKRINDCLDELQCIIMESNIRFKDSSIAKNGQRTAKLEKADILEMTVKYLRTLHDENKKSSQIANNPSSIVETSCDKKVKIMLHPKSDIILLMPFNNNSVEQQCNNQSKFSENDTKDVWRPW